MKSKELSSKDSSPSQESVLTAFLVEVLQAQDRQSRIIEKALVQQAAATESLCVLLAALVKQNAQFLSLVEITVEDDDLDRPKYLNQRN